MPGVTRRRDAYHRRLRRGRVENCLAFPHRAAVLQLPETPVKAWSTITSSASYLKGVTLFVEGQPARGVFILCSSLVKLSTSSADGKDADS